MSRWIDADALHDALKAKQKWVVRCGDKHNEGYTYDQVHFAIDEAPTIEAVSIDDYRSMENTCYKLQKALYEMADRKTENSSEIPNNCEDCIWTVCNYNKAFKDEPTISKMEQVDKDINVRSKDEPKISCDGCRKFTDGGELCDLCALGEIDNYEPKTEPQTDGYMTAEQTEDYRKMLNKAEHKVYGNIEDEPQTDGILFKGNLKEGEYKLIKTINGWVLEGNDIAYYGEPQTERSE